MSEATAQNLATPNGKEPLELSISIHARQRMQQRGVTTRDLAWLLKYGRRTRASRGATLLYFDKRARRAIERDVGRDVVRRVAEHLRAYAICRQSTIITAGKLYRRIRK